MDSEQFLTVGDVARCLDRSPSLVRQLANRGILPAIRTTNGIRLFERTAVDQLIAQRQSETPASELR
jgi:DNA-binding transcriptional MerR regulator